jgi:hypothetical protein
MEMIPAHKSLWIKLRAEIIKHFQDSRNPNLFINGYCVIKATERAAKQLEFDLKRGDLRLTLEEMLLNTLEECVEIETNRTLNTIHKYLSQEIN